MTNLLSRLKRKVLVLGLLAALAVSLMVLACEHGGAEAKGVTKSSTRGLRVAAVGMTTPTLFSSRDSSHSAHRSLRSKVFIT